MKISHNINSLAQLEKKLEESTERLAELTRKNSEEHGKKDTNLKDAPKPMVELNEEEKIETTKIDPQTVAKADNMPLAYSVNSSNGVSVQNSTYQSVLDIKA